MAATEELYREYKNKMQRIADIKYAHAVLQWDQETYLPPKGAFRRGQQLSTLSEMSHQLFSEDALGELLQELISRGDLTENQKRNTELTLEDYTKNKKYSSALVRALSDQTNKAFHSWIEARKQNSFSVFEKDLAGMVSLKIEEASVLGFEQHPYNALLNEFEKGSTVALLDGVFSGLLPPLKELLFKILAAPQVDDSFLRQHFPKQQQWNWGMHLLKQLNFDFEAGRQDVSEHPFSTSFNANDVRLTTRIDETDFSNMTWSCIHEAGHGLYEQGLPEDEYGLPLGEACSYSIHESQSRLWENNVGRGKAFWQYHFPALQQYLPGQFATVDSNQFYKGINKVQPSLIRTEADEITYHFHVYIRYELEKQLLEGAIKTADIPVFWKEQYKNLMDITVPDDYQGCLQDVHWSHGSFGYFPTYSLGSLYAAQFYDAARVQIPSLTQELAQGHTLSLLQWLRTQIHSKGKMYTSEELCKRITGKPLDAGFFVSYLLQKYQPIYNL